MDKQKRGISEYLVNAAMRGLIGLGLALPVRWRAPFVGWLASRVIGPVAGFGRRIRANLAHAWPDLPEAEVSRLCRAVPDNLGRTMIENYATEDLRAMGAATALGGPGLAALEAARAAGRPVILVTGHFGNYEVPRAALIARGWTVGGLYRPMNNAFFDDHYAETMKTLGGPVFPRGRKGTGGFVRHLKSGGVGVLLIDQYFNHGPALNFFGLPAPTAISAAELALKYDALMIPFYGIRQPDGRSFEAVFDEPIPHTDAETMTQAFNDALETRIRTNPGQWFWIHRRWKPERQRRRFAPKTAP